MGTLEETFKFVVLPGGHNPRRDSLIHEDKSLGEIVREEGVSRQAVHQYLKQTNQLEDWREKRKQRRETSRKEKEVREQEESQREALEIRLIHLLKAYAVKTAYRQSWAHGKTEEVMQSYRRRDERAISREKLFGLFTLYECALHEGKKISLNDLGRSCGPKEFLVSHLMQRANLNPMYGGKPFKKRNQASTAALIKVSKKRMPNQDIGYFFDLSHHAIYFRFKNAGYSPKAGKPLKSFGFDPKEYLTYRLASQIYEAQDLGFKPNDIAILLDAGKRAVEYALAKRKTIAPVIVYALIARYPNVVITAPYLQKAS